MTTVYKYGYARNYKVKCPQCGNKTFVPVVETGTKNIFHETVGKCDREINCGYRYDRAQYLKDNEIDQPKEEVRTWKPEAPKPLRYIPDDYFTASLQGYGGNSFVKFLHTIFPEWIVRRAIDTYMIGTSNSRFDGGCVFWFIDVQGRIKSGQVKRFKEDGHTDKYYSKSKQKECSCTCNVHTALKYKLEKNSKPLPAWLAGYIERGDYFTTLYGEHLLTLPENRNKPVALVEAPKTAIIASVYYPQYVWLATTALGYFTESRVQVLRGRNVVLFPDLGAFEKWDDRGKCYSHIASFTTSDLLERVATEDERQNGCDIADYLVKIPLSEFVKSEFISYTLEHGLPDGHEQQKRLCESYLKRGLSKPDLKDALNELIEKHGFEIQSTEHAIAA